MSGAEAIAVLGVISSVIAIVDGLKNVYDTVKDEKGLPKAFSVVADQLLTVRGILKSAKSHIKGDGGEDACKGMQKIIDDCEKKAETLDKLFRKIVPKNGALGIERYWKAVKAYGKGNEVESLMKGIMEDVQLLACEKGMKTATEDQQKQILKAIQELSDVEPSVPENESQGKSFTANYSGSGSQYNAQGENIAQGQARQYNAPGGTMNFGNQTNLNEDCLAALFLTNPRHDRADLIETKGSRADGTCKWIKTNELYKSWLHSESQLLWLSGGPGKGKTMLSIFLAEELEKSTLAMQNALLLQYFCDNKDEKRNTAVAILRGLVFQLLQKHQELYCHILPSFRLLKKSLFKDSSFRELWDIFENMVCDPVLGITYCVLDGLDECGEASLEVLLKEFKTLFSTKSSESSAFRLHLIVVSRDLPDFIPEVLSDFPRIRLDAESEVNDDIRKFIEVKVNELTRSKKYPEELSQHVKEVFLERAQGTFLWVGLVAQALTKYTVTEVEKALELFPTGLEQLYARMLLQIDYSRRETAAKILSWVVLAVRPLTLLELSTVIETTHRSHMGLSLEDVVKDQVSFCGDFLKINEHEETDDQRWLRSKYSFLKIHGLGRIYNGSKRQNVGLIHQSAKDYLLREKTDSNPKLEYFRVENDKGNLEIVRQCLNSLQNGAIAGDKANQVSHLRSYAVLHWPEHARRVGPEGIFDFGHEFFKNKSIIRENWIREYWSTKSHMDPPHTLLHLASYFGILPLAKNLLPKNLLKNWIPNFKIDKKDSRGRTALHWAAMGGHEAIVQQLLENKADIKAKDDGGDTVLHRAAFRGDTAVVQLLLENNADIKAKNNGGSTALHLAADQGDTAVVQLLLENNADIKAKDDGGDTVLHRAAIRRDTAIVQLLLENTADIKAKNDGGDTVLHRAAFRRDTAVVQLLLQTGADIEAKNINGSTALHWAADRGNKAIVQLLLENKADIKAKDDGGDTVLHRAAFRGDRAVVQLLLQNGADIEAKNINGRTALDLAYNFYDWEIVRMLKGES